MEESGTGTSEWLKQLFCYNRVLEQTNNSWQGVCKGVGVGLLLKPESRSTRFAHMLQTRVGKDRFGGLFC